MHDCIQTDRINKLEENTNEVLEFKGSTLSSLKSIFKSLDEIKNNHLHHVNIKLNALLFTVLGSVFVAVVVAVVSHFFG